MENVLQMFGIMDMEIENDIFVQICILCWTFSTNKLLNAYLFSCWMLLYL